MNAITDQATTLRGRMQARRRSYRIITVTSGKGGVGKTAIVANLGLELARSGASVILLDGDRGLANLAILFNVAPRATVEDVLEGQCSLDDALVTLAPRLRLLPAGAGAGPLRDLSDDGRRQLVDALDTVADPPEFVLIDTGAGISPTVFSLIGMADRTFVVTTHEPTALSDAYGVIKTARAGGTARLEIIVNMAASHVAARETHTRLTRLTERFLGISPGLAAVIPRDESVGNAVVRQQPMSVIYPYALATRAVAALARLLTDKAGT